MILGYAGLSLVFQTQKAPANTNNASGKRNQLEVFMVA